VDLDGEDLEDELKRLFADERLDVQVAADAEKTVVAGARRRRRRRVALVSAVGVVAAAVVATGTIVLARSPEHTEAADNPTLRITSTTAGTAVSDGPSSSSGPPSTSPQLPPSATTESSRTSTKPPTSVSSKATVSPSAPQVAGTVLNANGYGPFRFGMNQAQVEAAGQVTLMPSAGACVGYTVTGSGVHLYVSKTTGLAQVQVSSGVRTPEGIGVGSTEDDVKAKYPSYRDGQVAVPGNTTATYLFTFSTKDPKTVTDLRMVGSSGC
jgi:cytoskeletal protein RodZ